MFIVSCIQGQAIGPRILLEALFTCFHFDNGLSPGS